MHCFTSLFRLNGSFFANKTCYLSSLCKKKNLKNPRSTRFPRLSITGDERIELPLRVLETPVIPFDQSPLFFHFYFFFLVDDLSSNTLFIPYQHSFVNRLSVSLLYKRKWLHRHSLFSVPSKLHTFKSFLEIRLPVLEFLFSLTLTGPWSSPRPISSSQLHTLPYFHLCPIYLVVFKGSYCFRMGYLISRGASRLDAFSVYPFPAWLLCYALGKTTDTPAASPSRSSRTKDSSSQISYAHAG